MTSVTTKLTEGTQTARIVVLSINDVYDMYPDEHGRGGTASTTAVRCARRQRH